MSVTARIPENGRKERRPGKEKEWGAAAASEETSKPERVW